MNGFEKAIKAFLDNKAAGDADFKAKYEAGQKEPAEKGAKKKDITRCDSLYYKREDWFEHPVLTADTLVPKLIAEAGYSE